MRTFAYWLALLLVFQIPFEKLMTVGGRSGPTISRFFGIFVAVVWVLAVLFSDKLRKLRVFHLFVFLFLLWNAASIFWSISLSLSVLRLSTYAQLALMVIILWDLITTPAAVRAVLQAYVLGGWVSAGSAISNYVRGITAHENIVRYTATGFNENEVSLVLALGLPMAWYLASMPPPDQLRQRGHRLLKFVNHAYLPAALFSILLTASRGGLLCTVPAVIFMIVSFRGVRPLHRVLLVPLLVAALYGVHSLVPDSSYERLSQASEVLEGAELNGRGEVWQLGFEAFLRHPVTGVGTGAFQAATVLGRAAHNAYLSVLVEVGGVGFGLFVALIAVAFFESMRLPRWEAWLWVSLLLVWAIGVMPLSLEHRKPTWLILGMPVVAANARVLRASWQAARAPARAPAPALGHGTQ